MIEINAAAGLGAAKDGNAVSRQANQGSFRNFLDSLGVAQGQAKDVAPVDREAQGMAPRGTREETVRPQVREERAVAMQERPAGKAQSVRSRQDASRGRDAVADAREQMVPATTEAATKPVPATKSAKPAPDAQEVQVETVEVTVVEEIDQEDDSLDWQEQVGRVLGALGIPFDAAKLADLSAQDMRELDVALRAGLKGLVEGQPLPQVAQLVGELLPTSLQAKSPMDPAPAVPQLAAATVQAAPLQVEAPREKAPAAIDPMRDHKTAEIGRLAEKITELVQPVKSSDPAPLEAKDTKGSKKLAVEAAAFATPIQELAKEDAPLLPVQQAKETAAAQAGNQEQIKPAVPFASAKKEDSSAFLRLDPSGFQIQRTDLQEAARAEAKPQATFRPSGPAGEILAHQVYDEFQLRPGMDHREMVLKLWPRELGQVSVHIKMGENDRVEAKILVQNDNIRQALLEHTPVLRETLAKQGLELGNLSVSVGGGNAQGDHEARDSSRRQRSSRGWESGVLETTAAVAAGTDTGRRNGFNSIDVLT